MKFNTPWSMSPSEWDEEFGDALTFGIDSICQSPDIGDPPTIHRFFDLVLLPDGPVSYDRRRGSEAQWLSQIPGLRHECCHEFPEDHECGCSYESCERLWEIDSIKWAILITYDQAWHYKGSSLGKLVQSISLTPGEELEIQLYNWDRTKVSKDYESTDLVDKTSQTSLTTTDSAQVVSRMEKEKQWNFGVNLGFEYGVTAGLELGYSSTATDFIERRKEKKQEYTNKTAQQIRTERQIKISTVREVGAEERQKRVLTNKNPTRTITYNFFETLSHYQVDLAISEIQFAVAIPNKLPLISPYWVSSHEGVLKDLLLDETQTEGFEAARRLAVAERSEHIIVAIERLRSAFAAHPGESSETCERWESDLPDLPGRADDAYRDWLESRHAPDFSDPLPKSFAFIVSFLEGISANPSLSGLIAAVTYINDWLAVRAVEGIGYCQFNTTFELDRALARAYAAIVAELGKTPEITFDPQTENDESDNEQTSNYSELYLTLHQEQRELERAAEEDKARFKALQCHIEEHLLHYMRPIWLSEDPGVRLKRMSFETGIRLAVLTEEPLVGFHLNSSVFPVRLGKAYEQALVDALKIDSFDTNIPVAEGSERMVQNIKENAQLLQKAVQKHFLSKAKGKSNKEYRKILDKVINDSIFCMTECGKHKNVSLESLPVITKMVNEKILEYLENLDEDKVLEQFLTNQEKEVKELIETRLEKEEKIAINKDGNIACFNTLTEVNRRVSETSAEKGFNSIMVSLPSGGVHCEPVLGRCSAAEELRLKEINNDIDRNRAIAEQEDAEAKRRNKRLDELPASELVPEVNTPKFSVDLTKKETE